MQSKWSWFERTFNFDFPVEKSPDIIERLQGTSGRIETLVANKDQGILQTRETDDSWSVKENVGHLCDLEPLWKGRIADVLAGEKVMRDADLTNKKTFSEQHNEQKIEMLISGFRVEREELLNLVGDLDNASLSKSSLHPRLETSMRIIDLCLFVAEHDDYHLARMRYLLNRNSE